MIMFLFRNQQLHLWFISAYSKSSFLSFDVYDATHHVVLESFLSVFLFFLAHFPSYSWFLFVYSRLLFVSYPCQLSLV